MVVPTPSVIRVAGPHRVVAGTEARLQWGAAGWAQRTPTPSDASVTSDAGAVTASCGPALPFHLFGISVEVGAG